MHWAHRGTNFRLMENKRFMGAFSLSAAGWRAWPGPARGWCGRRPSGRWMRKSGHSAWPIWYRLRAWATARPPSRRLGRCPASRSCSSWANWPRLAGLVDRLAVLQPVVIDRDVPDNGGGAAGQGLQDRDALGLLMAQEYKGVGPAVGVPQLVRRDVPGKQHVPRCGVHGGADLVGEMALLRPAKPDETHLRHPPGQLGELGQALPGRPVPHRDDALLALRQAVPLPDRAPAAGSGRKKSVSMPLERV